MHYRVILALFLLFSAPALAQAPVDPYVATVDVTAKDAVAAKEQAQIDGGVAAFQQVMSSRFGDAAAGILKSTGKEKITAWVQGVEIVQEKITGTRYQATLKYQFDEKALTSLTSTLTATPAKSGAFTPTDAIQASTSMLVLPLLQQDGNTYLFEDANTWRSAWTAAGLSQGQGKLLLPMGGTEDALLIQPAQLFAPHYDILLPLAARYGTTRVAVAHAITLADTVPPAIDLTLTTFDGKEKNVLSEHITAAENETPDMLLARAATRAAEIINKSRTDAVNNEAASHARTITVLARILNSQDLVALRALLADVPATIQWRAISASQVDISMKTQDDAALAEALKAKGLILEIYPNYWVINLH